MANIYFQSMELPQITEFQPKNKSFKRLKMPVNKFQDSYRCQENRHKKLLQEQGKKIKKSLLSSKK